MLTTRPPVIRPAAPNGSARRKPAPAARRRATPAAALRPFVKVQAVNTKRHAAALRPFRHDEFGRDAASPSAAHIDEVNRLLQELRSQLLDLAGHLDDGAQAILANPSPRTFARLLADKDRANYWVKLIEKIWDFYLRLFGQRQTRYAEWLLATDRIALDCYQAVYTGLDRARSIPSPPPMCYMETALGPATFRRGVPLSRLGKRANPFPLVSLPYHRLINPWTLGAVHHEVSHNLQNDLGLWQEVPRRIERRLRAAGMPPQVARTWARWHKETWADLCGLLLGGPAIVASLMDVVARQAEHTLTFSPSGVHPTPYLRVLINLELLQRMGFPQEAAAFRALWTRMYPPPSEAEIPRAMLASFPEANRLVVDTICFQPYSQLGSGPGKRLADVVRFRPEHQKMVEEAASRLARGTDPGIIPARYLVSASRWAVDHNLTAPGRITRNFYQALNRR